MQGYVQKQLVKKIAHYRSGMADLLEKQVGVVREKEKWLNVPLDDIEFLPPVIPHEGDPGAGLRVLCALLLRKARLHMIGILRANEKSNVHSMAVQMRPILECAGQIVLNCRNLVIISKEGISIANRHSITDFHRTMISLTEGGFDYKSFLSFFSESTGIPLSKLRTAKKVFVNDRVKILEGGSDWYGYLSACFSHGKADWCGWPWDGGVGPRIDFLHEYTLASLMDYLVNQVAIMAGYATLCHMDLEELNAVSTWLHGIRATSKTLRDSAEFTLEVSEDKEQIYGHR
ncbi:MAG: hypothetical protein OXH34_01010 [Bacteroidetes bacterium]|nr:hypothetical protein [Bacteroidota bacterium]